MVQKFTSRRQFGSGISLDAVYSLNSKIISGLVSFGKMLITGAIVGILLAALSILYALSGIEDGPFVVEKNQPSAVSPPAQRNYRIAHNYIPN